MSISVIFRLRQVKCLVWNFSEREPCVDTNNWLALSFSANSASSPGFHCFLQCEGASTQSQPAEDFQKYVDIFFSSPVAPSVQLTENKPIQRVHNLKPVWECERWRDQLLTGWGCFWMNRSDYFVECVSDVRGVGVLLVRSWQVYEPAGWSQAYCLSCGLSERERRLFSRWSLAIHQCSCGHFQF